MHLVNFSYGGTLYSLGYEYADGRLEEVWLTPRSASLLAQGHAQDVGSLITLILRQGLPAREIAAGLCGGLAGAVLDNLLAMEDRLGTFVGR